MSNATAYGDPLFNPCRNSGANADFEPMGAVTHYL